MREIRPRQSADNHTALPNRSRRRRSEKHRIMSLNSSERRFTTMAEGRNSATCSSESPFAPGNSHHDPRAITQFVTAPEGSGESDLLGVRVGCDLVYETLTETSFLL